MDKKAVSEFLEKLIDQISHQPTREEMVERAIRYWRARGITDEAILDWLTERLYPAQQQQNSNKIFIDELQVEIALNDLSEFLKKQGMSDDEVNLWMQNLSQATTRQLQ